MTPEQELRDFADRQGWPTELLFAISKTIWLKDKTAKLQSSNSPTLSKCKTYPFAKSDAGFKTVKLEFYIKPLNEEAVCELLKRAFDLFF
jgi:hypothetical protein